MILRNFVRRVRGRTLATVSTTRTSRYPFCRPLKGMVRIASNSWPDRKGHWWWAHLSPRDPHTEEPEVHMSSHFAMVGL